MNGILISLLCVVIPGIIVPRISKIADIGKTEQFIRSYAAREGDGRYFISFPCKEAAYSLPFFIQQKVVYLGEVSLSKALLDQKNPNYFLANDQCRTVNLRDVRPVDTIFRNNTWEIVRLERNDGYQTTLDIDFQKSIIQKMAVFIRDIK